MSVTGLRLSLSSLSAPGDYIASILATPGIRLATSFRRGRADALAGPAALISGAPLGVLGYQASALQLAATTDQLSFPNIDLSLDSGLTVEMVVRNDRAKAFDAAQWMSHGVTKKWTLTNDGNRAAPTGFGATVWTDDGLGAGNGYYDRLNSPDWHHLVMTIDRSAGSMIAGMGYWRDGLNYARASSSSTQPWSGVWENDTLLVGGTAARFTMDTLAVYNRALSPTEIRHHYELGMGL